MKVAYFQWTVELIYPDNPIEVVRLGFLVVGTKLYYYSSYSMMPDLLALACSVLPVTMLMANGFVGLY